MSEEHRRIYELEYPSLEATEQDGPTLIVALEGYADAGNAVEGAADHLLHSLDGRVIVSFNSDELVDYRSRRPAVAIDGSRVEPVQGVGIHINALRDSDNESFLLLSGPEPDFRWEGFTEAVADLAERFNVKDAIALYAAPMAVPHTRPVVVTGHGNAEKLLRNTLSFNASLVVPGAAALYLEKELAKRGLNVSGYTAHVPNYVAASQYPSATLALLRAVSSGANLSLPLASLELDESRLRLELAEQTASNREISQLVSQLEERYDEATEAYRAKHPELPLPGDDLIVGGDKLGREFEAYLAQFDRSEDDPPAEDAGNSQP